MALRLNTEVSVTISEDNVSNPQDIRFASGKKVFTDATTYNESSGFTFDVPDGSTDLQIPFGSITEAAMLYVRASAAGLTVKPVPTGGALVDTPSYELVKDVPCVLGMKLKALYVSNATGTAQKLTVGAAGN